MATGALLLPPGYHPLIDGAVVPSGKLRFSRSGTTTDQNTYTDSTLLVANSNPVQLNATGGLDTLVYGNPASGFKYRLRIYSSADVLLDTHDDIVVWGADTTTMSEGSFTGTLTGMTGATTGTVNYRIVANSAGTGKIAYLWIDSNSAISGTSNTTALTMTGLPAVLTPSANRATSMCVAQDGGNAVQAYGSVSGTTITFWTDDPFSASGWTNSGAKGLPGNWSCSYPL